MLTYNESKRALVTGGPTCLMNTSDHLTAPVNVGSDGEFTILELVQKVTAMAASKPTIEFLALTGDDPLQRKPDLTLVSETIGWQPGTGLDDGLARTIAYFNRRLSLDLPQTARN